MGVLKTVIKKYGYGICQTGMANTKTHMDFVRVRFSNICFILFLPIWCIDVENGKWC